MPDLVTAPGASDANSYVSLEDFASYLDERLSSPPSENLGDHARALIMATRRLDDEEYRGHPARPLNGQSAPPTQALQWPRWGARGDSGWVFDPDVVPEIVKRATMELAIRLLADKAAGVDFLADPGTELQGLERFEEIKVDAVAMKPRLRGKGSQLPRAVEDILRPVLVSNRGQIALERG